MFFYRLFLCVFLVSGQSALAHEFWIEPEKYQVETGENIVGSLKNGENFGGISFGWFDRNFTRFDMIMGDDLRPVEGRLGDVPAINVVAPDQDGLLVIVHETTPSRLTYKVWDKFLKFVAHKDFASAAETHVANGWNQERFRESYTRHVKSLIAVGTGQGRDKAFGLATEFVALTNPYGPDFDGTMKVQLLYQGGTRADAQVEVFERNPQGDVEITLHRTNTEGIAAIPVKSGHDYLFDGVVLRPSPQATGEQNAIVWETLWAALTFSAP